MGFDDGTCGWGDVPGSWLVVTLLLLPFVLFFYFHRLAAFGLFWIVAALAGVVVGVRYALSLSGDAFFYFVFAVFTAFALYSVVDFVKRHSR